MQLANNYYDTLTGNPPDKSWESTDLALTIGRTDTYYDICQFYYKEEYIIREDKHYNDPLIKLCARKYKSNIPKKHVIKNYNIKKSRRREFKIIKVRLSYETNRV